MLALTAAPMAGILDNVNGLPTHALLVHFTVVVSTVAALAGLAYVVVPQSRRWFNVPLMVVGAASVVLGLLTPSSGERLEARVGADALVEKHAELGDQMGLIMIGFGILLIATMAVVRFRPVPSGGEPTSIADWLGARPGERLRAFAGHAQLAAALTALVLVGSVVSGIWIFRTGEAGAKSVWHDTPTSAVRPDDDER